MLFQYLLFEEFDEETNPPHKSEIWWNLRKRRTCPKQKKTASVSELVMVKNRRWITSKRFARGTDVVLPPGLRLKWRNLWWISFPPNMVFKKKLECASYQCQTWFQNVVDQGTPPQWLPRPRAKDLNTFVIIIIFIKRQSKRPCNIATISVTALPLGKLILLSTQRHYKILWELVHLWN